MGWHGAAVCCLSSGPTFADFDLDVGVALCDIFDAPNDLGHFGAGRGVGGYEWFRRWVVVA
jgi:hypothetical protein